MKDPTIHYPRLVARFKALIIDSFILLFGVVLAAMVFSVFEEAPGYARLIVFVLLVFLYEPILVAHGGTIGQRVTGIAVKSHADQTKNISLFRAFWRSAIKLAFGWLSFLTMITDKKNRALHDFASNSIVLHKEIPIPNKIQG